MKVLGHPKNHFAILRVDLRRSLRVGPVIPDPYLVADDHRDDIVATPSMYDLWKLLVKNQIAKAVKSDCLGPMWDVQRVDMKKVVKQR
jgi:hypothetical protein